jgi:hypothetical protein
MMDDKHPLRTTNVGTPRLRLALAAAAALFAPWLAHAAPADDAAKAAPWAAANIPWDEINRMATASVGAETPDSALPFARPSAASLAASPRKVYIYYFPFFIDSMDNQPIAQDHWTVHYLQRTGENGKFAAAGGMVRERPLPIGPFPTPYWRQVDESADVLRARAIGADGFGVGIQQTQDGNTYAISQNVCYAAAHVAPGFKVFPEPDGGTLKGASVAAMASATTQFERCPAALRLPNGHALLAPFAPQNEPVEYWRDVLAHMQADGVAADFIPVLLNAPQFAPAFAPISTGLSFWGARDPVGIASAPFQGAMTTLRHLRPIWMAPITPQDSRPKDAAFFESRNTEAFRAEWMDAIEHGDPIAHLITWNDYSEATEIAPSSGTQYLFYDLSAYYIAWFKTGKPPAILRDAIYYSHRNQIFQPDHPPLPTDKPYKLLGSTPLANDIEMIAMLTRPATLEIDIAGKTYRQQAPAGLTAFRAPAAPGRPDFRILRDNRVAVEKRSDWTITDKPDALSPLYFGGSSTRPFVPIPTAAGR